jgi:NTE family protein
MNETAPAARRSIDLALQGGGAHGAFTWGVLDRLLADPRIDFDGISGTSAGAMNAVVVTAALQSGGREEARAALARFWRAVSTAARMSPIQRTPLDRLLGRWSLDLSPAYWIFESLTRALSPYQLNPFNINPLEKILSDLVDFEQVRASKTPKLFIAATNVRTGMSHVFRNADLGPKAVLASACLPFMYRAVEIDGDAYWDGGYMGNPVLYPLVAETEARDLVLVQVNPILREDVPRTGPAILNRLNEITFNASLIKEVRAIALLKGLVDEGSLHRSHEVEGMRLHRIAATEEMADLTVSSKMNGEWAFLLHLREIGWGAAEQWLETCFWGLGKASTFDPVELSPATKRPAPEPAAESADSRA